MLGERVASPSEVIRAIASGYRPCCGFADQPQRAGNGQHPQRDDAALSRRPAFHLFNCAHPQLAGPAVGGERAGLGPRTSEVGEDLQARQTEVIRAI